MNSIGFADTVGAQLKLALRARTVYFLLAMAAFPYVVIALVTKLSDPDLRALTGIAPMLVLGPVAAFYCAALGGMWGLLAWRDEPPRARFYHWSLPVDMTVHEMSRLTAYVIWLFVGMSAYFACGFLLSFAWGVKFDPTSAGLLPWVGSCASGLIGFFLSAAISTAVNRPVEYMAGAFVGIWALALLSIAYHFDTLKKIIETIFGIGTHYSLGSAVMSGGAAGMLRFEGPNEFYINATPHAAPPVIAPLMLWLMISLALVVAASYVNRGRAS